MNNYVTCWIAELRRIQVKVPQNLTLIVSTRRSTDGLENRNVSAYKVTNQRSILWNFQSLSQSSYMILE